MRFLNLLALASCTLAQSLLGPEADNWMVDCSDSTTDLLSVADIKFTPSQPKAGDQVSVNIQGKLSKPLNEGSITSFTHYSSDDIVKDDIKLCDLNTCSVKQGNATITTNFKISSNITPSRFTIDINATQGDDRIFRVCGAIVIKE